MNKKIYNHCARATKFILFMEQEKEITQSRATKFVIDNFDMEDSNARRYIKKYKDAGVIKEKISPNGEKLLVWIS